MTYNITNNKNYPIQLADGVVIAANGVLENAPAYILRLPAVRALINAGELSKDERSKIITNPEKPKKVAKKTKPEDSDGDV